MYWVGMTGLTTVSTTASRRSSIEMSGLCCVDMVMVMGEISTKCYVDIPHIVRRTVEKIGYNDPACGFDARSCSVMTAIDEHHRLPQVVNRDVGAVLRGYHNGRTTENRAVRGVLHGDLNRLQRPRLRL